MILYEDEFIIVVHKPSGIATESCTIGQADVVSELKNYRKRKGEDTYIGVIHRLDQPVEGLLVFAKTRKTAAKLTKQLNDGTIKKTYAALADCVIDEGREAMLKDWLLKDSRTNMSKVVNKGVNGAKEARLKYKCVKKYASFSLLEVEIFTGRHHQIRVQLSHADMPLLGDMKYGSEHSKMISREAEIENTALIAHKLSFVHPNTNKNMNFLLNYSEIWKI